ncbi:hypothetical protein V6N12_007653 [Hibiscus sabdariffa]|uniref:Reverse transcriptase n=1 Tax=Hibiscus sabdariffa TaxID=183260 RepID=A0ABR2F2F0_9ROSI
MTLSILYVMVWAVNLPSKIKIKIAMWRIINNFVSTFANLQRRRLNVVNSCPFCHSLGETIEHLMRDCCFARQLSDKAGFQLPPNHVDVQWPYWLASFFSSLRDKQQRMLLVTYWVIWFTRNKAPQANVIKCNFDSAYLAHSKEAITRVICRDSGGMIMAACTTPHYHVVNAFVSKALACFQAIVFAKDLGFRRIVVKGDSLMIIQKVNCNILDKSIIAPIIHDIKEATRNLESVSFCFARREANMLCMCLLVMVALIELQCTGLKKPR